MGRKKITVSDKDNSAAAGFLLKKLIAHNGREFGKSAPRALTITLKSDAKIIGGLTGSTNWGWLYIRLLWVDEEHRSAGVGGRLIEIAEREARLRGCTGVWVDTFSPRAVQFYRRLKYTVFGKLDDFPTGHARFYLFKKI